MYWSRTGSFLDLLLWAVLMLLSAGGGWLLVAALFRLRPAERLLSGLALGLLLFALLADLLALLLPLTPAYWLAALLVAGAGVLSAWRSHLRPPLNDLLQWPTLLPFAAVLLVFIAINRGLALFDDYANLPLASLISAGQAPPPFYLNPSLTLDYHFGMHLLAGTLGRIGGFFPWSALDVFKALTISLAFALGVLFYRRWMGKSARAWWIGLLVLFAGGSRWLFLLLPESLLNRLSAHVTLVGSGMQTAPDLYTALLGPWRVEGDGPFPFSFAFISGVSRPLSLAMGSSSAMPQAALFLLLLLARRRWTWASGLVWGLSLAALALFSDHYFALVWGGLALVTFLDFLRGWRKNSGPLRTCLPWVNLVPLLPGLLLAPLSSGVLGGLLERLSGGGSLADSGVGLPGIALRWPPAVFSSHLGALSLADPAQAFMGLIEIGPLLFLAVPAVWLGWRSWRRGRLLFAGLAAISIVSFLAPLLLRFVERERDITRLMGAALAFWLILGLPPAYRAFRRLALRSRLAPAASRAVARGWLSAAGRLALLAGFVAIILGGVALFPTQMIAAAQTQPSYFVQDVDARMARAYWDRLPAGAWVIDPTHAYRPATLFARTTGPAYRNAYDALPEYTALLKAFDPQQLAAAGYRYVYLERRAWQDLTPQQRDAFNVPCVRLEAQEKDAVGDFRRLYDISACKP